MIRKISALELRHSLGDILNRTSLRDDQFLIERKGKTLAVLVPVWQFEKLQSSRHDFFAMADLVSKRTRKVSSSTIEKSIREEVRAVRRNK